MFTLDGLVIQHKDNQHDPFDSSILTGFVEEIWGYVGDYQHHRVDISEVVNSAQFPKMIFHRIEIPIDAKCHQNTIIITLLQNGWLNQQNPFLEPSTVIHNVECWLGDVSQNAI
jgi:hypothetical protein